MDDKTRVNLKRAASLAAQVVELLRCPLFWNRDEPDLRMKISRVSLDAEILTESLGLALGPGTPGRDT